MSALLTQCGGTSEEEIVEPTDVSGAKSALYSIKDLLTVIQKERPSASMGVYGSLYLAQGIFLPVQGALKGIESHLRLIAGQTELATNETFALLQEFGSVLQVEIVDMLNRSSDRAEALNRYIQTLNNVAVLVERKATELETQVDQLKDQKKEEKKVESDLEKQLKTALKEDDYSIAGSLQQRLTAAKGELAKTEARLDQTEDILDRYEDLLKVAQERLDAMQNNREILIAGLKVIEVPGIEDLRILEPGSRRKRGMDTRRFFEI